LVEPTSQHYPQREYWGVIGGWPHNGGLPQTSCTLTIFMKVLSVPFMKMKNN